MKNLFKLSFLLIPVLLVTSSCLKNNNDNNVQPTNFLKGKYTGKFSRLKIRSVSPRVVDTVQKAIISLDLNDNGYLVTPDGTGIHAASKGGYIYDNNSIQFTDQNITDTAGRNNLKGTYAYLARGTGQVVDSLIIGSTILGKDSVISYYQLKKTAN